MQDITRLENEIKKLKQMIPFLKSSFTKEKMEHEDNTFTGQNSFKLEPNISEVGIFDYFKTSQTSSDKQFYKYGTKWTKNNISLSNNFIDYNWSSVKISDSSQHQTSLVYNGYIYVSHDYGNTWNVKNKTLSNGSLKRNWSSISMSGDGSKQIAVDVYSNVYTSSDYGETWSTYTNQEDINSNTITGSYVCVSSDAKFITIVSNNVNSGIVCFYSADSNWEARGWNLISETSGIDFIDIVMSKDGKYQFALSSDGKLYKLHTDGTSFNWTNESLDEDIYIALSLSETGQYQSIISFNGILYTSNDFGNTLTKIITDPLIINTTDIIISYTGQNQYITTDDGFLYTSDDFGVSWLKHDSDVFIGATHFSNISISSLGNFITIVSNDGKILISNDSGLSWNTNIEVYITQNDFNDLNLMMRSDIALSDDFVHQTIVVFKYCIFVSNDSGLTWKQNISLGSVSVNNWESVCMSGDGKYQTACGSGVIAISDDYGVTWDINKISNTHSLPSSLFGIFGFLDNGYNWKSVRMSSNGLNQIVVSSDFLFFWSNNYGVNWNPISNLIPESGFIPSNVAVSDDFRKIYIVGRASVEDVNTIHVYYSSNSGETWDSITLESIDPNEITNYVSISSNGNNVVISTNFQIFAKIPSINDLLSFTRIDNMEIIDSKQIVPLLLDNQSFKSVSISSTNDNYPSLIVTIGTGYSYVLDLSSESLSWESQTIPSDQIQSLNWSISSFCKTDDNKRVAVTYDGKLYQTIDGINWSSESSFSIMNEQNNLISKMALSSDGKYQTVTVLSYLGEFGAVFNSDDYGRTFTKNQNIPPELFINVCMSSSGKYQMVCSLGLSDSIGGIFTSNDWGRTWQKFSTPNLFIMSIDISESGKYQTGISLDKQIFQSFDYGETWSLFSDSNDIFDDSYFFKEIMISSTGQYQTIISIYGYIYQSNNFGKTWFKNNLDMGIWFFGTMSSNSDCQTIVGVSFDLSFLLTLSSVNCGRTWEQTMSINFRNDLVYNVSMSGSGQYQTVISSGSIYNSIDYGRTFVKNVSPFQKGTLVLSVVTTKCGTYQAAVDFLGNIYCCLNYENQIGNYELSDLIVQNTIITDNLYKGCDIYRVGSSNGPITITLPRISNLFPSSKRKIIIMDDECSANTNDIIIKCSDENLISSSGNLDSDTYIISVNSGRVELISDGGNKWLAF